MKGLLWKRTVTHNRYSGTNSKNLWRMPLSYPEGFELSTELHIAKFIGRHLPRVSLVQMFSYEFSKTFKNTCFEEYLWTTASGWRLENPVEVEQQGFYYFYLVLFTLASLQVVFFLLLFTNFLCIFVLVFKTKLANRKLYGELRPFLKYNLKERDWIFRLPSKYGNVESADWNSLHIGSYWQWKRQSTTSGTVNLTGVYTISGRFS